MNEETDLIEIAVSDFLERKLDCPVCMEYPEGEAPDRFVLIDRTDGTREEHMDAAVFTVQSYGKTKLEAARLNHSAKAAMDALIELSRVAVCEMSNDYPFFDTEHKRHRYMAVYEITYY